MGQRFRMLDVAPRPNLATAASAWIRAAYPGATWKRLAEIKHRYDPGNLFRLNHNIPPADAARG